MTVKEFIVALQAFPEDQEVTVRDNAHPDDLSSRLVDKVVNGVDPVDGQVFVIIEVE